MTTLSDIFQVLKQIRDDLPALIERSRIAPRQIVTVTGLSDITERLGLVQAGEFRTGNSKEPGFGFSGVRMGYPAFSYNDEDWNIAGVENDELQFGVRASDGKAFAGGGAITLDKDGQIFRDAGDALVFSDTTELVFSYQSIQADSFRNLVIEQVDEINLISNGNFETGDFTDWTVTDPNGVLTIVDDEESKVMKLTGSAVGLATYIQQNLSSPQNKFVVKFRAKMDSLTEFVEMRLVGASENLPRIRILGGNVWRNYIGYVSNDLTISTFFRLLPVTTATADINLYVDDIEVIALSSVSSISQQNGNVTIAGDTFNYGNINFKDGNYLLARGLSTRPVYPVVSHEPSGTVNNFNLLSTMFLLELKTVGATTLTGINYDYNPFGSPTTPSGRFLPLVNTGAYDLILSNQDAGSDEDNRFDIGSNVTIAPGEGCILWHATDPVTVVNSRWKLISKPGGGGGGGGGGGSNAICEGRLTLETGVPISSTDQTAKATLYFTPYKGNQIGLYDGSATWTVYTFSELSLSLAGFTADKNYDIWIYDNAGSPALDSTIWTSDNARATALAFQDGIYVKSGTPTRRYLGTIRITASTGQCEDSLVKRYVWNYYNRVDKHCLKSDASNHNYNTATERAWNNDTSNRFDFIIGVLEELPYAYVLGVFRTSGGSTARMRTRYKGFTVSEPLVSSLSNDSNNSISLEIYQYDINVTSPGYHWIGITETGGGATTTFVTVQAGLDFKG